MITTTEIQTRGESPLGSDFCLPSYAYSFNEEDYDGNFDSREAAIAEAFAENESASEVWTGERVTPDRLVCEEAVIDQVRDNTTEESGDWADSYLTRVSKEAKDELQAELQAVWDRWEAKHDLAPTWFNVENPQRHEREDSQVNVDVDASTNLFILL